MPYLVFQEGPEQKIISLGPDHSLTIGRGKDNELSFHDNPRVSRHHCTIYYYPEQDAYVLKDMGSTNGTLLNGNRISSDVILSENDIITVGNLHFYFVFRGRSESRSQREGKIAEPISPLGAASIPKPEHTTQSIPKVEPGVFITQDKMSLRLTMGQFIEDYQIMRFLGGTAISSVYQAKQKSSGELVALKIYHKDLSGDNDAQTNFIECLKHVSKLQHPAFVRNFEAGIWNGHCFYTAEYIEGVTLSRKIAYNAPFTELRSLEIIRKIGLSLDYAYDHFAIVHRNLNPQSIVLKDDDNLMIVGYGMAEWASQYVVDGLSVASPWYNSPEQIGGRHINWQSDLYALGIMFFQMLTGVLPFHAALEEELLHMHIGSAFPQPSERNPNIKVSPASLEILRRMTAKNQADRYPTWMDFVSASQAAGEKIIRATQQISPYLPEKNNEASGEDGVPKAIPISQVHKKKLLFKKGKDS